MFTDKRLAMVLSGECMLSSQKFISSCGHPSIAIAYINKHKNVPMPKHNTSVQCLVTCIGLLEWCLLQYLRWCCFRKSKAEGQDLRCV